jgi:hypothetical protein
MASWKEIESEAPAFAARVRTIFESGTNKTLATLRASGAPRISASETTFADGELTLGMMAGSRKLADVRRDPRVALHSPTLEPPPHAEIATWIGDAKLAGSLAEIAPPEGTPFEDAGFFRLDITEAVLTYVGDPADHLVIETWHAGHGWRTQKRY